MTIWVQLAASVAAGLTSQADAGPWAPREGEACDRFMGKRRVVAALLDTGARGPSLQACRTTPLDMDGRPTPPDYCEKRGARDVYGVWLMPDSSCAGPRL